MRDFRVWGAVAALLALDATAVSQSTDSDLVRDAQATLAASCYGCHGEKLQMGGLRLDTRSATLAKAIVAGKSDDSLLVKRIKGADGMARMPMGGPPLPAEKIALI